MELPETPIWTPFEPVHTGIWKDKQGDLHFEQDNGGTPNCYVCRTTWTKPEIDPRDGYLYCTNPKCKLLQDFDFQCIHPECKDAPYLSTRTFMGGVPPEQVKAQPAMFCSQKHRDDQIQACIYFYNKNEEEPFDKVVMPVCAGSTFMEIAKEMTEQATMVEECTYAAWVLVDDEATKRNPGNEIPSFDTSHFFINYYREMFASSDTVMVKLRAVYRDESDAHDMEFDAQSVTSILHGIPTSVTHFPTPSSIVVDEEEEEEDDDSWSSSNSSKRKQKNKKKTVKRKRKRKTDNSRFARLVQSPAELEHLKYITNLGWPVATLPRKREFSIRYGSDESGVQRMFFNLPGKYVKPYYDNIPADMISVPRYGKEDMEDDFFCFTIPVQPEEVTDRQLEDKYLDWYREGTEIFMENLAKERGWMQQQQQVPSVFLPFYTMVMHEQDIVTSDFMSPVGHMDLFVSDEFQFDDLSLPWGQ